MAICEDRMAFDLPQLPLEQAGFVFAVLMGSILLGPLIAKRLRVPEVVAMVLLGFAVGPTGVGLVERAGVIETLGAAGLLYLLFVAGLELDLDDFAEQRNRSIGYASVLFVVPMIIGTTVAMLLGYPLLAALLIAVLWSSHTLLTYPTFQVAGTAGTRAVTTTVGATIVTDTATLLLLAVIARAHQGQLGVLFWATLIPSVLVLTAAVVLGLPRLTRRFFTGAGQDRTLRFAFVLTALFVVASLYDMIGIEAIVGAFLAGLVLNRSVPNGGLLMKRIRFTGRTLFIPLFLLATGMLIDLGVLADPRTLLVGAAFTGVAMGSRALAAVVAGRAFGWERIEIAAMFSLSAPQAASTLAVVIVGVEIDLIGIEVVNAVMLVVLVSNLLASTTASYAAPRLPHPPAAHDLGDTVVVPVANPTTAPGLMRLASAFARADGGLVVPLMVSPVDSDEALERMRSLEEEVLAVAQSAGAEAWPVLRIDSTPEAGIAHTLREQSASLLVLGWKGATVTRGSRFGGITDQVVTHTDVPTLLTFEGDGPPARILVVIDETVAFSDPSGPLALSLATARHLARDLGVPIEVLSNVEDAAVERAVATATGATTVVDERRRSIVVRARARPTDLIILPVIRSDAHLRPVPTRLLRATPQGAGMVVAIDRGAREQPEVDRAIAHPEQEPTDP